MGHIFYVMGKSASGKDTIYKILRERLPQIRTVVPYTTRPIRAGERDGVEYYFVTGKRLADLEKQGKIIEKRTYQTVYGPWSYATVDDGQIDLGSDDYFMIGTLESYEGTQNYFGADALVPLFTLRWRTVNAFSVRLTGNGSRQSQSMRSCAAVSWRMRQISVPKIWKNVGSGRKTGLKTASWKRVWIRW